MVYQLSEEGLFSRIFPKEIPWITNNCMNTIWCMKKR